MTIWAPGMRCVCVDDEWPSIDLTTCPLIVGVVYTVVAARMEHGWNHRGEGTRLCVRLAEVDHPLNPDWGFDAARFRPLSETRLDQFRQHLNRIPADEVLA